MDPNTEEVRSWSNMYRCNISFSLVIIVNSEEVGNGLWECSQECNIAANLLCPSLDN